MRFGRKSTMLGKTMISTSTPNIGASMIMVSFSASPIRIPATEQAIIRHSP